MSQAETITLTRATAAEPSGNPAVIPRQLGAVRLERELGKGGMGVVWLGRDDVLGRDVAVKFMLTAAATPDDPGLLGFIEGARAAAAVKHDGLVGVYNADTVENVPYLVMEYIDGPTVGRLLSKHGALPLGAALVLLEQACEAVGALHESHIIHRDIKPGNLLLNAEARLFVTDFGLACDRSMGEGKPAISGLCGTPAYMAPEMFDGAVSATSDVYALGILAYELLTGDVPYSGELSELRAAHTGTPLPRDILASRGMPEQIIEAVERATHKNPLFRYKSARHFLRSLKAAVPDQGVWSKGVTELSRLVAACGGKHDGGSATPTPTALSLYDHLATRAEVKRKLISTPPPEQVVKVEPLKPISPSADDDLPIDELAQRRARERQTDDPASPPPPPSTWERAGFAFAAFIVALAPMLFLYWWIVTFAWMLSVSMGLLDTNAGETHVMPVSGRVFGGQPPIWYRVLAQIGAGIVTVVPGLFAAWFVFDRLGGTHAASSDTAQSPPPANRGTGGL